MQVTDEMVSRFLTWPVPADVYPDGTPGQPGRTGTNLMTHEQARQMLTHVLAGTKAPADCADGPAPYYISGPYPTDGGWAVCELSTGRVLHRMPGA
jgi:hypothetical protein